MKRHHPYGGYQESQGGRGRRGSRGSGRHLPRGRAAAAAAAAAAADPRSNYDPYDGNLGNSYGYGYPPWGAMPFPPVPGPYSAMPLATYHPDPEAERPEDSKPCRTLFVRNVAFEVNVDQFRERFEQFGEIKTWFDLIQRRGLLFVTYFDTRAAKRAKEEMHKQKFYGRALDVHYSLPKEEDQQQHCDRDKNQGTLFALARNATQPLTDDVVRELFAPFGEICEIRPYKDKENTRFIEYWDSRACVTAHDKLNGSGSLGGELQLKFAWDLSTVSLVTDAKNRSEAKAAAEAQAQSDRDSYTPGTMVSSPQGAIASPATQAKIAQSMTLPTGDRLEQAQKVQQLLASLQSTNLPMPNTPPISVSDTASVHPSGPTLDNTSQSEES
ncbi:hypothetical protein MYAM1_000659 [Malassezia yamatoensis]|uniref:RRM domain-containing protein n=1 Tax=Malassezia yamatoensis TaxID=253288 RepID=A0AAJ5YP70_9BASI|nr:hypothetical protein MYAM1_000659 [Malassezia yamatoensis]